MPNSEGKPLWFSAGVVLRGTKVLVESYTRLGRTELKFIGGSEKTGNGRNDQSPEDTLIAEFREEAFEKDGIGEILSLEQVFEDRVSPEHTKRLYIVDIRGQMRTIEILDREEGKPDELLGVPFLIETEDLLRDSRFAWWHRKSFQQTIKDVLISRSEEWLWIAQRSRLI